MLSHDNDLGGVLPSEWALPSLVSIMLSNNPKLGGSLPVSLFIDSSNKTESISTPNFVLRSVIVEGTSIGGTLPAALCSAPQLVTLALSGNALTGSLPDCVTSLQNLQILCISNNQLTGGLPEAINNMVSLTVLDLSANKIQGTVPAELGEISSYLDTMKLQLNRLSCDLPTTVLDWQASSANVSLNLLDGNLFGCSAGSHGGITSMLIEGAHGLRNANKQAFDAYNCGNSDYILPAITIIILVVPIVLWLFVLCWCGRLALQWRVALEWMVNPSTLINELDHADRQVRALSLGVMVAATVAGSVALVLSLHVAKSAFECEYMAAPTLANKSDSDVSVLSIGVGTAVSLGLVLGLLPWWQRLVVTKCDGSGNGYGGISVVREAPLYPVEEYSEAWDYDAERIAEATPQRPPASASNNLTRVQKLAVLILALVVLTISPNVGYVLVVLSELAQQQKVASEMAVTLVKTTIGTLLVPRVARKAVDLLVQNSALTFVRFRLSVTMASMLSAITMIVVPVMIVLVTDKRCLYYTLVPQPGVHTRVPISYCAIIDPLTGSCHEYAAFPATSIYTLTFAYDGEVCVSAVLSVYGPVFLGVVLLAAALPAGVEVIIVPWLAPWCHRKSKSS